MLNNNILFIKDYEGIIKEWKIEEDNLTLISKKENTHKEYILTLLNIKINILHLPKKITQLKFDK